MSDLQEKIEAIMEGIIRKLNEWSPLSWVKRGSGSLYSKIAATVQLDFDYMFCPSLVQCRIEPCPEHPCYCRIFITNKHKLPLGFQRILGPNDEVTPSKYKGYVIPMFDRIVEENSKLRKVENKNMSPAYTVNVRFDFWMENTIDLVLCLQVQKPPPFFKKYKSGGLTEEEKKSCPIYVVPKKIAINGEELELWRMSFSTWEKKLILDKCSENQRKVVIEIKPVLNGLKLVRDFRKKDDWNLCSYHVATHLLQFFEKNPGPPEGKEDEYEEFLLLACDSLIDALKSRHIPHLFIPNFNLLQDADAEECQFFINGLKEFIKGKMNKSEIIPPKIVEFKI